MSDYKTPGVYVEEIAAFPATIVAVQTAVPAFIGFTEKDPGEVKKVDSINEFKLHFGGPDRRLFVDLKADKTFESLTQSTFTDHILFYAMAAYFENGGGPCFVVSAGAYPAGGSTQVPKAPLETAIGKLEYFDEPTLLVIPEAYKVNTATNSGGVGNKMLEHCAKMGDRFAILDARPSGGDFSTYMTNLGNQNLDLGASYYPSVNTTFFFDQTGVDGTFDEDLIHLSYPGNPGGEFEKTLKDARTAGLSGLEADAVLAAVKAETLAPIRVELPPSALIAGVYCMVDNSRGVWKAPANVSLRGVESLTEKLTVDQNDAMNAPTNGKAINALRTFTGRGHLVWGSRTLDGNSGEWRYIPVRRLFLMVEESVQKALAPIVFEPNDANTWTKVKGMVENFLNRMWRDGAIAGASPKEAYFVNVGLGSTMTPQDVLDGNMIVEIGMAAVRPAEFIVLKFSHKMQES
jgi:phage tail sheath protein FI